MIPVHLLDDEVNCNIEDKIALFVNNNLLKIIDVILDLFVDDNCFTASDIIRVRTGFDDCTWKGLIYDLKDMIQSDVLRTSIKPKYQFLLYMILDWWIDSSDDPNEIIDNTLSDDLKLEILSTFGSADLGISIIESITDIDDYCSIIFPDLDFLPENIATFVSIYLDNPDVFRLFFPDINLDDFRELMPNDLGELYDEKQPQHFDKVNQRISEEKLFSDLIKCCIRLQAANLYKNAYEDGINDVLRDALELFGYEVRDQTRHGLSASGKSTGEVDILVREGNIPFSIIEALRATCLDTTKLSYHINKIFNYDSLGNRCNFLVIYVQTFDFTDFWHKYIDFISSYTYPYQLESFNLEEDKHYSELKWATVRLIRNKVSTNLYHIVVHLNHAVADK